MKHEKRTYDNMPYDSIPLNITDDTLAELATLAEFNLLDGSDIPSDLIDSIINSNIK